MLRSFLHRPQLPGPEGEPKPERGDRNAAAKRLLQGRAVHPACPWRSRSGTRRCELVGTFAMAKTAVSTGQAGSCPVESIVLSAVDPLSPRGTNGERAGERGDLEREPPLPGPLLRLRPEERESESPVGPVAGHGFDKADGSPPYFELHRSSSADLGPLRVRYGSPGHPRPGRLP